MHARPSIRECIRGCRADQTSDVFVIRTVRFRSSSSTAIVSIPDQDSGMDSTVLAQRFESCAEAYRVVIVPRASFPIKTLVFIHVQDPDSGLQRQDISQTMLCTLLLLRAECLQHHRTRSDHGVNRPAYIVAYEQ